MTTFATPRSTMSAGRRAGLWGPIRLALERRMAVRATIRDLRRLSDHQLRDIGLSRDQIAGVAREVAGHRH